MAATGYTPAFGYDAVDDGWELDSSSIDDGWSLEPEPSPPAAPRLALVADAPSPAPAEPPAPTVAAPAAPREDGWSVAEDEAPRLELTEAEQAFFDAGDALVDQKVDTFEDLDPAEAPARPSLWRRLFHRD